jgi:TolA-binding protein
MPASGRTRGRLSAAALAAAAVLCFGAGATAQETTTATEAVERARALERQGLLDEAALYLHELVLGVGPLSEEPEVLIELARLTPDVDAAMQYLDAAMEKTRDARLLAGAHRMRGDFLFMQGRYEDAVLEYGRGAEHAGGPAAHALMLRRAASLLASGDASRAADAYLALVEGGGVSEGVAPWAELGLARAHLARGKLGEATAQFERVVEEYPDHGVRAHALAGAVECHVAAGRDSAAAAFLGDLESNYPSSYEAVLARDLFETTAAGRDSASAADRDAEPGPESD